MDQRGFSLTELLVALAVLAVILTGVFALQQQGQAAYQIGAARVAVQQNARVALTLLLRELRSAQSMTTVTGCDNATTGTSDITFVDQSGQPVRYWLTGTTLQRSYAGAAAALIGGVETFGVFCFAADGTTRTAVATAVRNITVSLTTHTEESVSSSSPSFQHAAVESRVRLRNL